MIGMAMAAVLPMLAYGDMPINGGIWRPISFDLGEPGTVVNATPPAPVSNAHSEVAMRACKLTREVLNQALALSDDPVLRGRIAGQAQESVAGGALYSPNQHGSTSVIFYIDTATGNGGPAQTVDDGLDTYGNTCMLSCGLPDIETHEAADPLLFLWRRLTPNSGGPGQTRGGQALEQAFALYASDGASGPGFNACAEVPPKGVGGGFPAAAGNFYAIRDSNIWSGLGDRRLPSEDELTGDRTLMRSKTIVTVGGDDVFVSASGSGGGVGDPLLRAPELVAKDADDGYITPEHALSVYGVVLDDDCSVRADATTARREDIRRDRIGGEPAKALRPSETNGVSLLRDEGRGWLCGHCDEPIAAFGENWREGSVVIREAPIEERFADWHMYVRLREASPRVVLREHFCPACAASLTVDVVTEDLAPLPSPSSAVAAI
jgi:N-methylhydantoinase B